MSIFFTSDNHWGHYNILEYCPNRKYDNISQMNEDMVNKWNEVISDNDLVYHLGDITLSVQALKPVSPRLKGIKKLIPGNHDAIHPYNREHKRALKKNLENKFFNIYKDLGWEILPIFNTIEFPGLGAADLCHMPTKFFSNFDDKYVSYRMPESDRYLLHGHTHSEAKISGRQIHVGVDAWNMTPVSLDQLILLISENNNA